MSGFGMAGIDGSVAAKADGIDAAGFNAGFNEFFANGLRAAFAEGAIVFVGAAFITMAFHFHRIRSIGFEIIGNGGDFGMLGWLYDRAIVFEMNGVGFEGLAIFRPAGMTVAHSDPFGQVAFANAAGIGIKLACIAGGLVARAGNWPALFIELYEWRRVMGLASGAGEG